MAKQTINIDVPNSGGGTPARDAFDICNDNFTELYDGKLANVVEDTTPQLGGDLDVQANSITTSTVNGGITLTPNGTGDVTLGNFVFDADQAVGVGTDNYVFTYDNATGKVSLEAAAGGGAFTADGDGLISATSAPVLDAATGDEAAYTFNYTTNKAAGNDTGLLINQTDTASPGTSNIIDVQVGGSSLFVVRDSLLASGRCRIEMPQFSEIRAAASRLAFGSTSDSNMRVSLEGGVKVGSAYSIGFASGVNFWSAQDVYLYRDAANTLALRNGANAQTFNVYNTYTDASNYERGFMKWNANVLEIGTEAAGTGTARDISFLSAAGSILFPDGSATDPSFAWATNDDTGFYKVASNSIGVANGGAYKWLISATGLGSPSAGGAIIRQSGTSATNPGFYFASDVNTGVGNAASDQLSLIAGGVEGARIEEGNNGTVGAHILINDLTTAPTGNATGGGYLYSEGGALKWRGSSGTVTTIANA